MNATDKLEMQVSEENDGSAVAILPANIENPQADTENDADDGDDEESGSDVVDSISIDDPEREAIREARREERRLKKQLHREKARESNHLITALKKQNTELANRVASLETRTSGAEMARLEKAIDDAGTRVEYAKMKMQEAVNNRQGDEVTKAQQLWYDSQRQLESLQSMRDNANKQISQPKQNIKLPDPSVQQNATAWMKRNDWYDPQLKDSDSKVAQSIDQTLTEEGYDPSLTDYWEELDERLQKYLPHRYDSRYSATTRNSRPRSAVKSSGRESIANSKANEFRISPERVKAIKEAGMWDNIELRKKMANKFAEYDRQQKRG
jgi:hypothetical protein